MAAEGLLPYLQEAVICSYPEPDQSDARPTKQIPLRSSWILFFHLHSFLPNGIIPSAPKACMHLSSSPHVPHAPPISCLLIWSPKQYLVGITNHESPYFAPSCSLMLPCPFKSYCCSGNTGSVSLWEVMVTLKKFVFVIRVYLCAICKLLMCLSFHNLPSSVTVGSKGENGGGSKAY